MCNVSCRIYKHNYLFCRLLKYCLHFFYIAIVLDDIDFIDLKFVNIAVCLAAYKRAIVTLVLYAYYAYVVYNLQHRSGTLSMPATWRRLTEVYQIKIYRCLH